jgi:hypothetical protein
LGTLLERLGTLLEMGMKEPVVLVNQGDCVSHSLRPQEQQVCLL